MGRSLHNNVLDAALEYIKDNGDKLCVCNAEPTTYLEATDSFMLMETALAAGDYTIEDGSVDGRRLTVASQNDVAVSTTGTASHFAIVDTVNEHVLLVTPCQSMSVTSGETENLNSFSWTSRDPVAPS